MAQVFESAAVIGASSGIGAALVRQLAAGGTRVAAVARRQAELDAVCAPTEGRARAYVHDVRQFHEAPTLFDQIVADLGPVDLVVYNAGVMPRVAPNEYNFAKDRDMVEVNLLGAMAWLGPAAAYMEERRRGTLVGISSVAGDRGRVGNPGYHASKAGLTTYMESLRNRLSRHGVDVVTVKPGPVETEMTKGLRLPLMIDAETCARGTLALARAGTGEGYVPSIWGPIMMVIRNLPSVVFRRTNV
jgi:short-subunit dehydrogenase